MSRRPVGSIDLSNADFEFIGENSGDYAGRSVSPAGDVDGDGLDDLFVGAWGNAEGGISAGKAYLIFSQLSHLCMSRAVCIRFAGRLPSLADPPLHVRRRPPPRAVPPSSL